MPSFCLHWFSKPKEVLVRLKFLPLLSLEEASLWIQFLASYSQWLYSSFWSPVMEQDASMFRLFAKHLTRGNHSDGARGNCLLNNHLMRWREFLIQTVSVFIFTSSSCVSLQSGAWEANELGCLCIVLPILCKFQAQCFLCLLWSQLRWPVSEDS